MEFINTKAVLDVCDVAVTSNLFPPFLVETINAAKEEICKAEKIINSADEDPGANKPLTPDELREMQGEPVWVDIQIGNCESHWAIVYGETVRDGLFPGERGRCILSFGETGAYNLAWVAYRNKPNR